MCDTGPALKQYPAKPKFLSLGQCFTTALRGEKEESGRKNLLGQSTATVFNCLLAVRPGEDDNGVELGIIQLVHCIGSNVEESVATPATDTGV